MYALKIKNSPFLFVLHRLKFFLKSVANEKKVWYNKIK